MRLLTLAVTAGTAVLLAGCGVTENPEEPAGKPVELKVTPAKFSKQQQRTGDAITISMTVTNTGENTAPNVVVTWTGLENAEAPMQGLEGAEITGDDDTPNRNTRSPWFVDEGPGGTALAGGYSYDAGPLEPGRSKTLRWRVSPMVPGTHELTYRIVSGLTDNQALKTSGEGLTGRLKGTITNT